MDDQQARLKVSAAILSKNAENHIEPCLRSITWVDEIVLVDGHSTDRTCEIAEQYGARVVPHDFVSFPAERAFALEQTTNNWVLSLDTDMIVPVALAEEIKEIMRKGPEYDGYLIRSLNHFLGREIRHCSWFDHRFLRFFNKTKGCYDLSYTVLDGFNLQGTVGKLNNFLVHHQTESLEEYVQKMGRLFAPKTADEYIMKGVKITPGNVPWYFLLKPFLVFLHKYVYKRGFLDGIPGLIISLNSAYLYYCCYAIVWDRQRGTPSYKLERYLGKRENGKQV